MVARALHAALPTAASAPVAFASSSSPVFSASFLAAWCAAEPTLPWGATVPPASLVSPVVDHLVPPASREEARALRDALTRLITRERHAAADFLLALADFDRRRGWAALGHRSLFDFLKKELKCSSGAASHRSAAARLVPEFPAVVVALRAGDLCLSSLRHLARVLRPENEADYLPRFFGLSAREAEALAAELLPRAVQPRREVVTRLKPVHPVHTCEQEQPERGQSGVAATLPSPEPVQALLTPTPTSTPTPTPAVADLPLPSWERAGVRGPGTVAPAPPATQVEPLSADLRRLHLTVSTRLLGKLELAKAGLAHARPSATTEQVLEAALDLLLEQQDRRKGLVKRPRSPASLHASAPARAVAGSPASMNVAPAANTTAGTAAPANIPTGAATCTATSTTTSMAAGVTSGPAIQGGAAPSDLALANLTIGRSPASGTTRPRFIPAAIRREVWLRDGRRCQHPLDTGGTCGATHRLELDHLIPLALGGPSTVENLRVVCAFHNLAAARAVLGSALVEDQRARARRGR